MTREELDKKIDECCSLYYVIIGTVYNVANSAMIDAVYYAKQDKRYRHKVKREFNLALKAFRQWETRMRATLGDRYDLFVDTSDGVEQIIKSDLQKLFYAFDAHLMKNRIENHRMLAYMVTATTIIKLARYMFDNHFDNFKEANGIDIRSMFSGGDFSDVAFHWNKATEPFLKTKEDEKIINFNESKDCELAYEILYKRLLSSDTYNLAGRDALEQNEEVCRKYDPDYEEKKQELDMMYKKDE